MMATSTAAWSRPIILVAIVTLAGAALRLAMLSALPLIVTPDGSWAPDNKGYIPWGVALLDLGDFAGPAVRTPGYPLFLAATFAVLGLSGTAVLVAQHLLGLATVALLTLMAARLSRPAVALVTGLVAALDPWHLLFAHYALSEGLMVFGVTASAAAVLLPRRHGWPQGLIVGALAGATCLVRPTGQLLAPFVALAWLLSAPRPAGARGWLRPLGAVAAGLLATLGPWLAFNHARGVSRSRGVRGPDPLPDRGLSRPAHRGRDAAGDAARHPPSSTRTRSRCAPTSRPPRASSRAATRPGSRGRSARAGAASRSQPTRPVTCAPSGTRCAGCSTSACLVTPRSSTSCPSSRAAR
jgi:hypothetical protein